MLATDVLIDAFKKRSLPWFCLLLLSFPGLSLGAPAQQNREEPGAQALEIARDDPRVKDVLLDFPGTRLEVSYSEEYGLWVVEFLLGDMGELGMATVSLEENRILEFDFRGRPARTDREEEPKFVSDEEYDRGKPTWISIINSFRPHFEGISLAWLSFVIVLILIGNFERLLSLQNLDILLLYLVCPFLNIQWSHQKIAYTGIFLATLLLFGRCVLDLRLPRRTFLHGNIPSGRVALFLLALVFLLHIQTTYERGIGDAGVWSSIGAEYLERTGHLPYGTAFGPNCIYGPLMYVLYLPGNQVFPPDVEFLTGGDVAWGDYDQFEMRGVQSTVVILDSLTLLALYKLGVRFADRGTGILLALVFALSPYILGMTSELGLERASHVSGPPFILYALLWISSPVVAGLLLGFATGMLYYPAFLIPLWFGFYWRKRNTKQAVQFLGAYGAVGLVCLAMIVTLTVPGPSHEGMSPLEAFISDTIYQQQFRPGYATSALSFWGQYPSLAKWGKPAAGILYLLFCVLIAFFPRKMSMSRLAALTAAVLVGTQLVLAFAGGTYIGFYLAPLIVALFLPGSEKDSCDPLPPGTGMP